MENELKPCPFCGGCAELITEVTGKTYMPKFQVKCKRIDCMASTRVYETHFREPRRPKDENELLNHESKYYQRIERNRESAERAKEKAITAWNRRCNDGT